MAQQALGRLFNVQSACDGVYINMARAGGITFVCYLSGAAGDTYTLVEAKDSSGTGSQNLACITEYFTNTANASDTWTRRTQAAAATVVTAAAATQNQAVFHVQSTQLSDTYKFVKVTSTGAGLVAAMHVDLYQQRTPANLPVMGT